MITMDEIYEGIIRGCFINNGCEFDDEKICFDIYWSREKEGLLGLKWRYEKCYDEIKRTERLLSKLPNGITYKRTDILLRRYESGREHYVTKFEIHVSASYSKTIV